MKKTRFVLILAWAASLGLLVPGKAAVSQQTAGEAFEKALYVEEGQGDLPKAIGLYQDLVKRFPGDREVAAKALLHIGLCYEKLGKTEARNAYNRLLREYGDQLQPAKEARLRLAKLKTAAGATPRESAGLVFRKLDVPDAGHSHQARLSPDGSKFLYVGYQDKAPHYNLRVLDLASGKTLTVVEDFNADAATILFEWSPDGTEVVYVSGRSELRLVDADGGKPELLWASPEKDTYVRPLDWSGQSHALLISLVNNTENTVRLAVLPDKGGAPRTIVSGSTDDLGYRNGQFSPDGMFIVGEERKDKNVDVYVWAVEGGEKTRITDHQADDYYPLWSPDGKYVVFTSDRAKTYDLWAIPMDGSRPAGEPVRLQANIGKNKVPSDLTRSGQLVFYAMSSAGTPSDLFVLPVDPKTGEAAGDFRPFAAYPTKGQRWAPDGKRIAYTSRKGNIQLPNAYVVSGGASDEMEIPARNYWMNDIEWARDGKSLIFPGWNNDDVRTGIFRISLENLKVDPILGPGDRLGTEWKGAYINLRWLPLAGRYMFFRLMGDGKEEIYLMDPKDYDIERVAEKAGMGGYSIPSPDGRSLIAANIQKKTIDLISLTDSGIKVLMSIPSGGLPVISWAPDGKSFVYTEDRRLKIYSVPDGPAQTLVEAGTGKMLAPGGLMSGTPNTIFSPDGTKIAYALQDTGEGPGRRSELWIVDAEGGSPRKTADAPASHPLLSEVVWHPSGKAIFANAGTAEESRVFEHWVMENFLPDAHVTREEGPAEIRIRKIWDNAVDSFFMGAPSPDGKYLTYVDWQNFANLGVRDLVKGENRLLTDIKTWENGEMCYGSVFSPDGGKIAYSFQTKDMLNQLRTVNLEGSSTRILHDGQGVSYQVPFGWTPDGKYIATILFDQDRSARIAFVSAEDGSVRILKEMAHRLARGTPHLSLSPDGKHIVFSFVPRVDIGTHDIHVISAVDGLESTLVEHPADDVDLGWSPDGGRVFFTSDRTGAVGVWSLNISGGKATGMPELVRGDIGNIRHLGIARSGKLYYGIYTGWSDIFVAPIDPATGHVTARPEKAVHKYETFNFAPDWSLDGQSLVCLSQRGKMAGETPALLVRSMRTNEIREVRPKISGGLNVHYLRWAPDGRSVFGVGLDESGKYGALLSVDIQTGEARTIARAELSDPLYYPDRAADGKSVYFIRSGKQLQRLIRLDLASGTETEILRSSRELGSFRFALSPDGRQMAVIEGDRMRIHALDGTGPRELAQIKDIATVAWMADGKSILYGKLQDGSKDVVDLWVVPVNGGEPQKANLSMSRLMHLRVSPDGKSIAFTASEQPGRTEVWVMENFLTQGKK